MSSRVSYTNVNGVGPFSFDQVGLFADSVIPWETQLTVLVSGVEKAYVSSAPGAGQYTINKPDKFVQLGDSLSVSDTLTIKRVTNTESYIDFTNNSPLTAEDLDITAKQSLFLAEEGIDAIESGDAVLSLAQLTDVVPTLTPSNGQFLRYDESSGKWNAQSFSPDGIGPDVNIVTEFPPSGQDGDTIYHSVYGGAYIYAGGRWRPVGGTGYRNPETPGTVVAELTWPSVGDTTVTSLETAGVIPTGWHVFVQQETMTSLAGQTFLYHDPNRLSASANWIDLTAADQLAAQNANAKWQRLWVLTGVEKTATGRFQMSNSLLDSEARSNTYCQYLTGNTGLDDSAQWYADVNEDNAALQASSVLMPRLIDLATEGLLCPTLGVSGTSALGVASGSGWRALQFAYPTGLDWGAQSWRITIKGINFGQADESNSTAGIYWIPKNAPFLVRGDSNQGWDLNGDPFGIVARLTAIGKNDSEAKTHARETTSPAPIGITLNGGSSATLDNSYIIPMPSFVDRSDDLVTYNSLETSFVAAADGYTADQCGCTADHTTTNSDASLDERANAFTVTVEWDALGQILTAQTTVDSTRAFTSCTGSGTTDGWQTVAQMGPILANYLSQMSGDFWMSWGGSSGSATRRYSGVCSATKFDTPLGMALTSVKVEAL